MATRALTTIVAAAALAALASSASAGGQTGARGAAKKKKVRSAVDHVAADGAVLRRTVVLTSDTPTKVSRRPDLAKRNRNEIGKGWEIEDGGPAELAADRQQGTLSLQGALELDSARQVGKLTIVKLSRPGRAKEQAAEIRVIHRARRVVARRASSRPAAIPIARGPEFVHQVDSTLGPLELTADPGDPESILVTGGGLYFEMSIPALIRASRKPGRWVVQSADDGGTRGLKVAFEGASGMLIVAHGGTGANIDANSYDRFVERYNDWLEAQDPL